MEARFKRLTNIAAFELFGASDLAVFSGFSNSQLDEGWVHQRHTDMLCIVRSVMKILITASGQILVSVNQLILSFSFFFF